MGFLFQNLQKDETQQEKQPEDLQKYYINLFKSTLDQYPQQKPQIKQTLSSIFSRTKIATNTHTNRQLKLIDIDKIMSLKTKSIAQRGQEIKTMRVVSGMMNQTQNEETGPLRQIHHLVRMARLHFISNRQNQQNEDDSDDELDRQNQMRRLQQIIEGTQ